MREKKQANERTNEMNEEIESGIVWLRSDYYSSTIKINAKPVLHGSKRQHEQKTV